MKHSKAIEALSALAQETRMSLFLLLLDTPEGGITAGNLSTKLNVPPTTLSFHLSQLKSAGLVESIKNGRNVIYTANRKRAKKLGKYINGKP